MTTILILIVIITLFIILISNSKTNNKSNIKQEDLKRSNYSSTVHIDKIKGDEFSSNTKSREQHKMDSLLRIASSFDCEPSEAKEIFFKRLRKFKLEMILRKVAEQEYKQKKLEQSIQLNIHANDTPAAYMEEWTNEYIENKEYSYRKRTKFEVMEDIMALYPEYGKVIRSGNKELEKKFIDNNPHIADVIMEELTDAYNPAEKYRLRAFDTMSIDKNYLEAINLLNKGLEFDEPQTEPFIYELKAKCQEKLLNFEEAAKDINKAIALIPKNIPDYYYTISEFFKKGAEINDKLDETNIANTYRKEAEIFYAKAEYEASKYDNNDLPF